MSASKVCPRCHHSIKQYDDYITCIGMCKETFHVGCARLTPDEYSKFLTSNGVLQWVCHSCSYSFKKTIRRGLTVDLSTSKSIGDIFKRNEGYQVHTSTRYEINEQKKSLENVTVDSSEVLISQYRKEVGKNSSNDGEMIIKEVTNRREIRTKIVSPSMEFVDKEKRIKLIEARDKKSIEPSEKDKNCKPRTQMLKSKNEDEKNAKVRSIQEQNRLQLLESDSSESLLLHVKTGDKDQQYVECCQFIKPDAKYSNKDKFPELLRVLNNESFSPEKIKIQDKTVPNDKVIKNNETIKNTEETLDGIKAHKTKPNSEKIGNDLNNGSLNTLFAQKNSLFVSTDHMDHKNTGQKRDEIKKTKNIQNKIPNNTLLIEDLIQNVSNVPTQPKKEHKPNTAPAEFFINKSEENLSNHELPYSISTIIDSYDSQIFDELCVRKCMDYNKIENKPQIPLKSIIKAKEEIQSPRHILCNKVTINEVIEGDQDSLKSKSKTSSQTKIKMKPAENRLKSKSDPLQFDKFKEEKSAMNKTEGPRRTIIINQNEKREPYEPTYFEIIKQMFGMGKIQFDEETEVDDDIKPSSANASNQYTYKTPCSSTFMNTTVKMCQHYERDTQFPEDYILEEDEETKKARELVKGLNKSQVEKIRDGELIRMSRGKTSRKASPKSQKSRKTSPKET